MWASFPHTDGMAPSSEFDRERATDWVAIATLCVAALACLIAGAAVLATTRNPGGWVSLALGAVFSGIALFQLRRILASRSPDQTGQ